MSTIKDVAKKAGVSVTTVSRALNGTAPVNSETKEKIMQAVEELNFTPNVIAQGMRTKRSKTIAVIIPDYVNPFYYEFFKYLEDCAKKEGYHVIIASSSEDAADDIGHLNDLISRNIDGIIVCSYKGEQETIEYLLQISKSHPVIFMDHMQLSRPVNSVYTDGYEGMKQLTNHMIGLGHRKIAFIKPLSRYKTANDRFKGFMDAMGEAGLQVCNELVYEGNYHMQSGYDAAKYFFSSASEHPTALMSSTDLMAVGAVNYLKAHGYRIPEDIAVAGFDDIYMSVLISPPLTTYRQPVSQMAEEAVKLLLHRLRHAHAKDRQIVLKGELIVRRSTSLQKKEIEKLENM